LPEGDSRVSVNVAGYAVKSLTFGAADLLKDPITITATSAEELKVTLTGSGPIDRDGLPALPPLPGRD
jgi:hypothetical protein